MPLISRYAVIFLLLGLPLSYLVGYDKGKSVAKLECKQTQIKASQAQLKTTIEILHELTVNAATASREIVSQMANRQLTDTQTTKSIKDALQNNSRTTGEFSVDILRQLNAARERANIAASIGLTEQSQSTVFPASTTGREK